MRIYCSGRVPACGPDLCAGAPASIYAYGLRNCAGLTIQAQNGDLWCTVNERDLLGDNLAPDVP